MQDPDTGVTTYKDPNDGMVYEYDEAKKAWFPKLDSDFMAVYQLNYGFTSDGIPEPTKPDEEPAKSEVAPEPKKEKIQARLDYGQHKVNNNPNKSSFSGNIIVSVEKHKNNAKLK